MNRFIIKLAIIAIGTFTLHAQQSIWHNTNDEQFRNAIDLFQKEKYNAAQHLFDNIANSTNHLALERGKAGYYATLCALELYNDDAEVRVKRFVNNYPESSDINSLYLASARYFYNKKRYKDAFEYFAKVQKDALNDDEAAEYYFKLGYSYFMVDSMDKARMAFYEIKDIDTKYTSSAIYYYAHIAYTKKQYETAITGFKRLSDDEMFGSIVPYYITQCYYFQERYDSLISYAIPLLDSVVETREAEMAKLIGDAWYKKNKHKEALPYLKRALDKSKEITADDNYQYAYCLYQSAQYPDAVPYFEKATGGSNLLSQSANYLLGDCYIKTGNKNKARTAFAAAAKADFDKRIKEDAAFNYAVLSYELSYAPFNEAIKSLNDYLEQYPESRRNDEAYQLLVAAYLNTRNYQSALEYIEKIKNKDKSIKKAYQRVCFFRGLEVYNTLQFDAALKLFDKSLTYAENDALLATRAWYWSAECFCRVPDYNLAIDNYNLFVASPAAIQCPEYAFINYNLGYAWFNKKEYAKASDFFSKYIEQFKKQKIRYIADAYNRLADCQFMALKYQDAANNYSKATDMAMIDKDYAIYQKAFCLGLLGQHNIKIGLLNQLVAEAPNSSYIDDAYYETGRSYVALQNPEQATKFFNKVLTDFKGSSYIPKAQMQLGLIQYNAGKNTEALETYKNVVAQFPNTPESRSALTGIKTIYVEMNDVDTYLKYTETLGGVANVSQSEQDSLSYIAGENLYMTGDCNKSKDNFKKYLERFPNGNFALNAHYYKADCNFKNNEYDEALISFNYIISKQRSDFIEDALVKAGFIYRQKQDHTRALECYIMLESIAEQPENILLAKVALMELYQQNNDIAKAAEMANKVLATEKLATENERKARYVLAKGFLTQKQDAKALEQLRKLAKDLRSTEGAEAKYLICNYYYTQGQTDKAEKEIFNFIDQNTPHQYWMAKSFLVLSDIYLKKKDVYQANSTLQSIIDNYENKTDGIVDDAIDKKMAIENKDKKPVKQEVKEVESAEEPY